MQDQRPKTAACQVQAKLVRVKGQTLFNRVSLAGKGDISTSNSQDWVGSIRFGEQIATQKREVDSSKSITWTCVTPESGWIVGKLDRLFELTFLFRQCLCIGKCPCVCVKLCP